MKIDAVAIAIAMVLGFGLPAVMAQSSALPSLAASAPLSAKPLSAKPPPLPARPLTSAELRDSGSAAIDDRREGTVTPQIRIPLGKTAPTPMKPDARPARRGVPPAAAAGTAGIDDAAARCEAQADAKARAACRRPR